MSWAILVARVGSIGRTAWSVVEWLGYEKLIISAALSAAAWWWAATENLPLSIISIAVTCLFVALLYLFQISRLMLIIQNAVPSAKPDYSVWRRRKRLTTIEAACLFADREPTTADYAGQVNSPSKSAWYRLIVEAAHENEIERVKRPDDSKHQSESTGRFDVHTFHEFTTESLRKYAESIGERPKALFPD